MADLVDAVGCGPGAWWVEERQQAVVFPAEAREGLAGPDVPPELRMAVEDTADDELCSAIAFALFHRFVGPEVQRLDSWGCDRHERGFHYHYQRKG